MTSEERLAIQESKKKNTVRTLPGPEPKLNEVFMTEPLSFEPKSDILKRWNNEQSEKIS